jgi:hypothetical protein
MNMNTNVNENSMFRAFFKGFASVFNFSGGPLISIHDIDSGFQKDKEALAGDWRRVGGDMRRAMNIVRHER